MHIHIPDGVLPIWLWVSGYLITIIFLAIALHKVKKEVKKIPLAAMLVALMLVVMSIPLGVPFHMNLSVFSGLIIGIYFSLIISFIVNFILAFLGHGGITIVGLNALVLWFEAIVGIFLFKVLKKYLKNYFIRASISTFFSLICSTFLVIGIVAISTINPGEFLHEELGHLQISLPTYISLILPIAIGGSIIEALVTGFLIQYIKKIKPNLVK